VPLYYRHHDFLTKHSAIVDLNKKNMTLYNNTITKLNYNISKNLENKIINEAYNIA